MPMQRALYPKNWEAIVAAVRQRSGNRCEMCGVRNGELHPVTGSRVVLTTAHYPDPTPMNCDLSNLLHLCQRDHLRLDAQHHADSRRRTQARRLAKDQNCLPILQEE